MDPKTLGLILQAAPLFIAPLASAMTKGAEKLPAVPYVGGSRLGIIAALTVAALACRVGLAWVSGTLVGIDWEGELRLAVDAIAAALMAAGGYAIARSDKPALPGQN